MPRDSICTDDQFTEEQLVAVESLVNLSNEYTNNKIGEEEMDPACKEIMHEFDYDQLVDVFIWLLETHELSER
jgi:hypothetical protein